ncbi:autoinducer binding domain-containing protein, partial [Rhizobium sp. TRM95111]|uniref:autoinducer binding domain-containing protein n=1 Tax=Rhizobium alarense TaxID=2846851 RepID=UPI001F1F803C
MDIRLPKATGSGAEIRLSRPVRRTTDFVQALQVMQKMVGARHFAVLRVSGNGMPASRKLVCVLSNWAAQTETSAVELLRCHGATMMEHLERSMLPLFWDGAGDGLAADGVMRPFTSKMESGGMSSSGIAFPVRLGSAGNGYVVFTGSFIDLSSEIVIDTHMRCCQMMIDMLVADERKAAPA